MREPTSSRQSNHSYPAGVALSADNRNAVTVDHDLDNLAALADAYGVATRYENADRCEVEVEREIIIAILAQFNVDASTPESILRELATIWAAQETTLLPPTLIVREGTTYDIGEPAILELEDGTHFDIADTIPSDLPLGWHRVRTANQDVTLAVVPRHLPQVPFTWGWMLQLYALHSPESWGMGDFGDLAVLTRRSADELGAGVLLVNPVQAISPTHPIERSPYSPSSRRFINPLYLRVTATAAFAHVNESTRQKVLALQPPHDVELIDYDQVWDAKLAALELLWPHHEPLEVDDPALLDFATFSALTELHGADWRTWPVALQDPQSAQVAAARKELADRVAFHAWLQQLCHAQLDEVRLAAHETGMPVGVIHDLPVGVHPGGVDTWALREAFAAQVTVGAPPDAFNQQGQDWGLPPWRPDQLAKLGYAPFRDVLRSVLRHADGIRIDHIAGLWRLWWIPPGEPPTRGTYVQYDAEAMMGILALEAHRAGAVVVGEDLGTIEPEVTKSMHERGVLSSAVLWFQRDWKAPEQPFIPPSQWEPNTMASVSTHDLPTVAGWLKAEHVRVRAELGLLDGTPEVEYASAEKEREALMKLVSQVDDSVKDKIIALHALLASAASRLVLTSPADVLGETRQPNVPGTINQYPNWRIPLPASVDEFFASEQVRAAVAPLQIARPLTSHTDSGDKAHCVQ